MKGLENFGGVENRNESQLEHIDTVKNEMRNALVMTSCADADGFQDCMTGWLDKNEALFEESFALLMKNQPEVLEDWDSADMTKRERIIDALNDPIVNGGSIGAKAA